MYVVPPIPEPAPGDYATASWARALVRAIRSMRLSGGPGARVSATPSGTTVSLAPDGAPKRVLEVRVAELGKISGSPVTAPTRPLSAGPLATGRPSRVWALDLAMEEDAPGEFTVVAFPVARLAADEADDEGQGG